jgi:Mn2+/Fe2+ NRAMP family transporter
VAAEARARVSDRPVWRQGDLPHAPAYTLVNLVRVIGPGAILLGVSLGAGDWLLGPAVAAAYGPALLWICTLSILFQGVLNAEMARYTLATGEPIFTGLMRQRPGARFWATGYSLLHLAQVGWPGWALAAGSALAALLLGRVPRVEDRDVVVGLGYLIFLGAVGLLLLGRRAQRAAEVTEWIMMAWMLGLLRAGRALRTPGRAWTVLAWASRAVRCGSRAGSPRASPPPPSTGRSSPPSRPIPARAARSTPCSPTGCATRAS